MSATLVADCTTTTDSADASTPVMEPPPVADLRLALIDQDFEVITPQPTTGTPAPQPTRYRIHRPNRPSASALDPEDEDRKQT